MYPNLEIVYELKYDPNAINLCNRIKDSFENIDKYINGIKLVNDYTEESFINVIKERNSKIDVGSKGMIHRISVLKEEVFASIFITSE
ncbi:hypothetical protein CEXT_558691 [Caerostris extrusa]|uniref:DUF3627 domain-containing protein n=1 Tax=Caerostris extrusa TaxID=172846 RepID=A0AAV4P0W4_CAEEX|nr:hypothetical protein CEXT_558691 [Caerostris extrusa]